MTHDEVLEVVEKNILKFCFEFLKKPYMSYTEHGLHAQFYHQLLKGKGKKFEELECELNNRTVLTCRIQKEYPTAHDLGKTKRQNWDIAILSEPCKFRAEEYENESSPYDYLELHSVVEFGLNEYANHLEDDIDRLTHRRANILKGKFVVHLVRINEKFSGRDRSSRSAINDLTEKEIAKLTRNKKDVKVYFGKVDLTGKLPRKKELWLIKNGESVDLLKTKS